MVINNEKIYYRVMLKELVMIVAWLEYNKSYIT